MLTSARCEPLICRQSTSWWVLRPARISVARIPRQLGLTGIGPDYGGKPSDWWESADRIGEFLRTCLQSELEASTGRARPWKRSTTPAGRSWWVLTVPERRTSARGCGSSLPTLPGLRVSRGGYTRDPGTGKPRLTLEGMFFGAILPIPRAGDGTRGADPTSHSPNLMAALATPSARDWRSGKSNQHGKNARPLNEQFERMMLPTPVSADGERQSKTYCRGNPTLLGASGLTGRLAFLLFRSWMMGLPPSWLETALSIAPSALPRATPSSRRSPARSSEP